MQQLMKISGKSGAWIDERLSIYESSPAVKQMLGENRWREFPCRE